MHVQQNTPSCLNVRSLLASDEDEDHHFGGDQSPLNDADADEDSDPEGELDLSDLGLDEFGDADKLDIGASTLG
ncbi:MAG TPA: hypothetical protein VGC62_22070 [Pseudomonas sp.]|jgi:hypothetical protein|uniref:hypothetical protein n=1 Tax=Pseudomonas sp. TaxID=306 RepID=UPI002ED9692C